MTTPAYDVDGMAWQLRRVYHFTITDCTPGSCTGRDCPRMSSLDSGAVVEDGFRAVAELAWRIADAQIAKMSVVDAVVEACRAEADVADLVSSALAIAAEQVGGVERLLARRPGSWEADHVRNLARR